MRKRRRPVGDISQLAPMASFFKEMVFPWTLACVTFCEPTSPSAADDLVHAAIAGKLPNRSEASLRKSRRVSGVGDFQIPAPANLSFSFTSASRKAISNVTEFVPGQRQK